MIHKVKIIKICINYVKNIDRLRNLRSTFNLAVVDYGHAKYVIVPVTCELHTIRTPLGIVTLLMELRVSCSIVSYSLEYLLIPA
jgi:hypothetical protein